MFSVYICVFVGSHSMCDPNGHWVVSLIPRLLAPTESLGVRLMGGVQAPSYHNYEGHKFNEGQGITYTHLQNYNASSG